MQNIETTTVNKGLCQVGSEDVDGFSQRNPKNSVQHENAGDDCL